MRAMFTVFDAYVEVLTPHWRNTRQRDNYTLPI